MTKKQYYLMLDSAQDHLNEIKNLISNYDSSENTSIYISQKIRYYTVDMESALDYIAFELFNTYFMPIMEKEGKSIYSIEKKLRNVNFPNFKDEKTYNKRIKDVFPRLNTLHPEISTLLKDIQPFNHKKESTHWLTSLNDLVNTNKHRHLSLIQQTENAYINYMKDKNGNIFQNLAITGSPIAFSINGVALSNSNANALGITDLKGHISKVLSFKSDSQSVEITLEEIYRNTESTIDKLNNLIEKI